VLGSHGHRTVADFIHGTTVDAIRHRVDIPVLVAPAALPRPDNHSGSG
jgi:nucleotide-binding universal stress UspA family protein